MLGLTGACLTWILLVKRLARRLEERADRVARDHEAAPGTYARALEKIYRANLIPAVLLQRRPLHPHLYDRLLAAGVTPDYPRPLPPTPWGARAVMGAVVTATAILCAALFTPVRALSASEDPRLEWVGFAIAGLRSEDLIRLARRADDHREPELGLARWVAAARLDPTRADLRRYAAVRLELAGRHDEAQALLATRPP